MDLLLPASLLAQGSVKGKNDISLAKLFEAGFGVRNSLEGLSFASLETLILTPTPTLPPPLPFL